MMNNTDTITHKELLTFSNLTNLEWEFSDLEPDIEMDQDGNEYYEYKPLIDLLTPKVFTRRETDPDTGDEREIPVYGEGEKGLIEMRKEAGIAMEYAEKLDEGQEGEFLKDWEVIYGGDKYKILTDYIDERLDPMREMLKEMIEDREDGELTAEELEDKDYHKFVNKNSYLSRDELKEEHEAKIRMEFRTEVFSQTLSIASNFRADGDIIQQIVPKDLGMKILKRASVNVASEFDKRAGYLVDLATAGGDIFEVDHELLGEHMGEKELSEAKD